MRKVTGPYLMHETEGAAMIQTSLQTSQDKALKNIRLKEAANITAAERQDNINKGILPLDTAALLMSLDATFIGNPFFDLMQQYYIDFHTNTQADNIYTVSSVTHEMRPGNFTTKLKAHPPGAKDVYVPLQERLATAVISLLKQK